MLFTGKFELSIDAKRRLAIPARVRGILERARASNTLFIIPGANGGLWLWPERTFEAISGEVSPSLTPAAAEMDYNESTFPEAEQLDMDTAGRIRMPQHLVEEAGLGDRVLLLGMGHHMEVWDPAAWAEHRQGRPDRPELAQRARSEREKNDRGS